MIDKFAFVQGNKATDHSIAYADSDSSNRKLMSLSGAIAMWISLFGQVEYLGVSTCPIPTQASTFQSPANNIISSWYQGIFYPAWMSWCQKSTVALNSWICGLSNLLPIISQHCFHTLKFSLSTFMDKIAGFSRLLVTWTTTWNWASFSMKWEEWSGEKFAFQ